MLELGVLQVDDVGLVVVEGDRRGGVCRLQDPIDGGWLCARGTTGVG